MVAKCPSENTVAVDQEAFWDGHWDAHKIGWLISGAAAAVTLVVSLITVLGHAINYHNPRQQRQIIRILFFAPVFAIISFFSYRFFRSYTYYELIQVIYEAFAIAAFLMLMLEYIGDSEQHQREVFAGKDKKKLPMPFCCWRYRPSKAYFMVAIKISVVQYCFIRPALSIAGIILEAYDLLCEQTLSPEYGYVYILAIDCAAISIALYGLFVLYGLVKDDLQGRRPLAKFLTIKGAIFFTFYQSFVFSILQDKGVIKATEYWTATNVSDGLNALCTTLEMVIVAAFQMWAFPWTEYRELGRRKANGGGDSSSDEHDGDYDYDDGGDLDPSKKKKRRKAAKKGPANHTNPLYAILHALWFADLFVEVWHAMRFGFDRARGKEYTRQDARFSVVPDKGLNGKVADADEGGGAASGDAFDAARRYHGGGGGGGNEMVELARPSASANGAAPAPHDHDRTLVGAGVGAGAAAGAGGWAAHDYYKKDKPQQQQSQQQQQQQSSYPYSQQPQAAAASNSSGGGGGGGSGNYQPTAAGSYPNPYDNVNASANTTTGNGNGTTDSLNVTPLMQHNGGRISPTPRSPRESGSRFPVFMTSGSSNPYGQAQQPQQQQQPQWEGGVPPSASAGTEGYWVRGFPRPSYSSSVSASGSAPAPAPAGPRTQPAPLQAGMGAGVGVGVGASAGLTPSTPALSIAPSDIETASGRSLYFPAQSSASAAASEYTLPGTVRTGTGTGTGSESWGTPLATPTAVPLSLGGSSASLAQGQAQAQGQQWYNPAAGPYSSYGSSSPLPSVRNQNQSQVQGQPQGQEYDAAPLRAHPHAEAHMEARPASAGTERWRPDSWEPQAM